MKTVSIKKRGFYIYLAMLLFVFSLSSCHAGGDTSKKLTDTQMSAILKKHITLKDTMIVIEISRAKANKLGISNAYYDTLVANINRGNNMVKETLKAKDAVVGLYDLKNDTALTIRKGNQRGVKK
jgi:hypothetical protein